MFEEEYEQNLAKLTECLEAREQYRADIKAAKLRGMVVPPHLEAEVNETLKKFDEAIDKIEGMLGEEYERILADRAEEAEITELAADAWEMTKHTYIIIKHTTPHLLDSFTKQVIDPMDDEDREDFLDGVAILEATKLAAILKGEA